LRISFGQEKVLVVVVQVDSRVTIVAAVMLIASVNVFALNSN
jgi:hypothetical protein